MNTPPEETRALEQENSRLERREQKVQVSPPDRDPNLPFVPQTAFFPEEFNCERQHF